MYQSILRPRLLISTDFYVIFSRYYFLLYTLYELHVLSFEVLQDLDLVHLHVYFVQ